MTRLFLGSVLLAFFMGCGGETKPSTTPSTTTSPAASSSTTTASSTTTTTAGTTLPTIDFSQTALPKLPVPDNSEAPPPKVEPVLTESDQRPDTVLENAKVGDGAKGHYSEGMILTPVATMFRAEEMIAFKIEIPHAMQYYKAEHDHAPKTHEEFMKKIIEENHISLPELPEGQRFLYDPKTEQLMVERPAK